MEGRMGTGGLAGAFGGAGRVGRMVTVGDEAPGFELLDQDGGTVSLSGLKGHKMLVYFYPETD